MVPDDPDRRAARRWARGNQSVLSGNRVRIAAQLIDTKSGAHLWSEAYEEELEDIFGIQLAIATQIADTLQAEFSPSEKQRVAIQITTNPDAYAHYLRALSLWGNFAPTEPVHEALDDAIAADPNFATALAYKAWVHGIEATFGRVWFGPSFNADAQWRFITLAEQYAQRALALDEEQALAHVAMSTVHGVHRNWAADLASMERAYALSPNDYRVVHQMGWRYASTGRVDEGLQLSRHSVELNPGDFANIWNFGQLLYFEQRFEEMKRLRMRRGFGAMAEARNPGAGLSGLAFWYGLIGDAEAAKRVSRIAQSELPSGILHPSDQFWLHMATKDYDLAIRHLDSVIATGFPAGFAAMPNTPISTPFATANNSKIWYAEQDSRFNPPAGSDCLASGPGRERKLAGTNQDFCFLPQSRRFGLWALTSASDPKTMVYSPRVGSASRI